MQSQSDLFSRWFPYWMWECYLNGMWEQRKNDMNIIQACANLLSDAIQCNEAMELAIKEYPISAKQHLSKSQGKRPWMGQSACCVALSATEEETRIAWNFYMTPQAQDQANKIADEIIEKWSKYNA